jgi:hypothetical protein
MAVNLPSINNLDQMHWKGMTPIQSDDEGIIINKMESGIVDTLYRFHYERYNLVLQFLDKTKATEIKLDLINAAKDHNSQIILDATKAGKAGYFDFSGSGDPTMTIEDRIVLERITGTDYWNISLTLSERFEVV